MSGRCPSFFVTGATLACPGRMWPNVHKEPSKNGVTNPREGSMKYAPFTAYTTASAVALIFALAQAAAHSPSAAISADEVSRMLGGKTCTTKVGAKFMFGPDGQYAYEGLWKNGGRYAVSAGMVTVTLDNGLERSFAISRKGDTFYMEQTALSCRRADLSRAE